ncbi:MAG: hypothetical protein KME54_26815 [Tolypothrix brevis GSE-NOS-MK-07-07A]|jgi:hypothetical protein|nr:hypothetical protein [Tolypothrix brevis GSE-NOS-MK-07-07A]
MVRQRFKPFQKAKDAKEFWDNAEDPQEGLVPLFNSPFYATPDEPADPRDCNRYPDSPYCGGFPFTKEPISIDISLVRDECNLGIQLGGSLGFIKIAPLQIVYRNPDCILPPAEPELPPPNTTEEKPSAFPPKECAGKSFCIAYREINNAYVEGYGDYGAGVEVSKRKIKLVEAQYPYTGDYKNSYYGKPQAYALFEANGSYKANGYAIGGANENFINSWKEEGGTITGDPYSNESQWETTENQKIFYYRFATFHIIEFEKRDFLYPGIGSSFQFHDDFIESVKNSKDVSEVGRSEKVQAYTRSKDDFPIFIPSNFNPRTVDILGEAFDFYGVNYFYEKYQLFASETAMKYAVICGNFRLPTPQVPPPMSCCPKVEQNDQLLKLILKKIGSTNLPASVPKVLTDRKKGTIKIESLAEFTAYTVRQLDAVCGRYPIDIDIEDADLTKEGNQTKKIKLPNIAETLAEMMGMLLVLRSESDATLNATIRALTEAGSAKQMAFMAYEYAKANAEFLGYKGEQKERKIAFAFKPGEARLDKMLQEGEISVKGWENEDKDDFNDLIAPLLELAAMWKVANYRKTGAGDPKEKLKQFLKNAGKLSDDIDAGMHLEKVKAYNAKEKKDKNPKDLEDDWDKFTEETEMGFISQPGILDKTNPYGRPLEERPKIRDISSDTSE